MEVGSSGFTHSTPPTPHPRNRDRFPISSQIFCNSGARIPSPPSDEEDVEARRQSRSKRGPKVLTTKQFEKRKKHRAARLKWLDAGTSKDLPETRKASPGQKEGSHAVEHSGVKLHGDSLAGASDRFSDRPNDCERRESGKEMNSVSNHCNRPRQAPIVVLSEDEISESSDDGSDDGDGDYDDDDADVPSDGSEREAAKR